MQLAMLDRPMAPIDFRRLIADGDSDDPPFEQRAAIDVSWDAASALADFYEGNPPPFHPIELGRDLFQQLGDDGEEIYRILAFDAGDTLAEIAADWASFDRGRDPGIDRLLIDEIAAAMQRGWNAPADVAAVVSRLSVETEARRFRRIVQSEFEADAMPFPPPSNIELPAPDRLRPRRLDAATLEGKAVPDRSWLVPGLIPAANVTLIYGDGGVGKSLLALMLGTSISTGTPFFGRPVTKGGVEFLTAEDSVDELHRRLADIARAGGASMASLAGLSLASLADDDAILAAPEDGRGGALTATALYDELDSILAESRPALLILDTLADVYGGNEIVRAQVRQFIGMLRRLSLRHGCAVVVLAHPSVAGMEKGTSGSTGWSNSVRSRLYLDRVRDSDGREPDEDARVLRVHKSNYGRVGLEIGMRWQDGVFVAVETFAGDPLVERHKADVTFLSLVLKYAKQDRAVSASPGANYAPKIFEAEARAAGIGKRALTDAMNRLLDNGRLCIEPYGPPSRGTKRLALSTHNSN